MRIHRWMLCAVVCLVTLFYSGVYAEILFPAPEDAIRTADAFYENSSYTEKDRKEIMESMIKAADKWPNNYQIQWRAARAIHVYADAQYYQFRLANCENALRSNRSKSAGDVMELSEDISSEQGKILLAVGVKARVYADRAVALNPQGVEGYYYNAMAISIYAYGKSIIKALMEGLGTKYEQHLTAALKINKLYKKGALYTAFGRYWYSLPWPKRNNKKSLDDLLVAIQQNPNDIQLLDFLGDTYYALKQKSEAKKVWEECLRLPKHSYNSETIQKLVQAKLRYL